MAQSGAQSVYRVMPLTPGLYVVATPIGSARDITLRALDILASVDVIAAEDTRMTRKLMEMHGVALNGRPVLPYHDHNGAAQRPRLMAFIAEGKSVAFASDAGTPLVADPGFDLVRAAISEGFTVTSAPGPSAVLAGLTLSGLPTDRFLFAGFPPNAKSARLTFLKEFQSVESTLVFFESPKRVATTLAAMIEVFGADRPAALCRELTKKFEQARRGTLQEVADSVAETAPKGEIVLVLGRPIHVAPTLDSLTTHLQALLSSHSVKEAARILADETGVPKRDIYQLALSLRDAGGGQDAE
jgi:16S rRNA (cytidine1402-2'-O)-methyltransferase